MVMYMCTICVLSGFNWLVLADLAFMRVRQTTLRHPGHKRVYTYTYTYTNTYTHTYTYNYIEYIHIHMSIYIHITTRKLIALTIFQQHLDKLEIASSARID
jgi:hypothetical protein